MVAYEFFKEATTGTTYGQKNKTMKNVKMNSQDKQNRSLERLGST